MSAKYKMTPKMIPTSYLDVMELSKDLTLPNVDIVDALEDPCTAANTITNSLESNLIVNKIVRAIDLSENVLY